MNWARLLKVNVLCWLDAETVLHSDGCFHLFSTPCECSKENIYQRKLKSETYILLPSVQLGKTN